MGRRSIEKERKEDPVKKQDWVERLFPYFQENGFRVLTMDDIARRLGKSKATIYKYFESREDIVVMMIHWKLETLSQFESILADTSLTHVDRYRCSVKHISKELFVISAQFLADIRQVYPHLWLFIDAFRDYSILKLKEFYEDGIHCGAFNKIDTGLLALNDQLIFDALSDPKTLNKLGLSLQVAFDEYFKMRFEGILQSDTR